MKESEAKRSEVKLSKAKSSKLELELELELELQLKLELELNWTELNCTEQTTFLMLMVHHLLSLLCSYSSSSWELLQRGEDGGEGRSGSGNCLVFRSEMSSL